MKKLLVLGALLAFAFSNTNAQTLSAANATDEVVSVKDINAENTSKDKEKSKKKKDKKKSKECADSKEKSCGSGEKKKACCSGH